MITTVNGWLLEDPAQPQSWREEVLGDRTPEFPLGQMLERPDASKGIKATHLLSGVEVYWYDRWYRNEQWEVCWHNDAYVMIRHPANKEPRPLSTGMNRTDAVEAIWKIVS